MRESTDADGKHQHVAQPVALGVRTSVCGGGTNLIVGHFCIMNTIPSMTTFSSTVNSSAKVDAAVRK